MLVWRIARRKFALDTLGMGAQITGGRWNSPGIPVIYAGLTPSIAAMEKLAHTSQIIPVDLVLVSIDIPDDETLYARMPPAELPEGWDALPSSAVAVKLGNAFIAAGERLGLIIPSAILPEAMNVVLNPSHSAFRQVKFKILRDFNFDERLTKS